MAKVKTSVVQTHPVPDVDPKKPIKFLVRMGCVVHRTRMIETDRGERQKVDIFDGDDPDSNEVDLLPNEVHQYLANIEPLGKGSELFFNYKKKADPVAELPESDPPKK